MQIIEFISYLIIPLLLIIIFLSSEKEKISAYDSFIEGASEGFHIISRIFPTMLAVIVAINLFKVSGAMDIFVKLVTPVANFFRIPTEVVPIGAMRSVSGGGALAILSDILSTHGPDSLIGKIASTIMGSSDTTLYVVAMYTATIGISKTKGALVIGLICDFIAVAVACWIFNFL